MKHVTIIAEAGVNHNGDLQMALELIDVAADAGADYVKFQTFRTEDLVQKDTRKADYQIDNTGNDDSQFSMLKKLEIPLDWYPQLIKRCEQRGIRFLSTGFDEKSIDLLDELNCPIFKVPSGEITNKPYLEHISTKGKPVILSTGMSDLEDIRLAMETFLQAGIDRSKITVLHCTTQYPTPFEDVNLKAMQTIADTFQVNVGYSDHTESIEVAIAAVALGATLIEKHFTLDRSLPGPDHLASLEPKELKSLVQAIRNIQKAISGDGRKVPSDSELKNIQPARKSIHLSMDVAQGTALTRDHLIMLRPGNGISPMEYPQILGKRTKIALPAGSILKKEDLE
jgi:N-acetylneuraminate synthase/N,N'-diacetyllegionaminate synthase